MQYDERSDGAEIKAGVNEEFEVALPETRTAGYRWVSVESGEPILKLLSETTSPNTGAVGGTGRHVWRFRAVSAGEAKLKLDYRRPWEKSAEPTRTFSLNVHVGS
ncbi:MAG: protease inhibitor I42 family protein [Candidatus Sulfotelmatobacter sp.]